MRSHFPLSLSSCTRLLHSRPFHRTVIISFTEIILLNSLLAYVFYGNTSISLALAVYVFAASFRHVYRTIFPILSPCHSPSSLHPFLLFLTPFLSFTLHKRIYHAFLPFPSVTYLSYRATVYNPRISAYHPLYSFSVLLVSLDLILDID